MILSKQNQITKLAYEKGYRVSLCGKVVKGLKVSSLKLSVQIKKGKPYHSFSMTINGSKPTRCYVHKLQAYQKFGEKMFEDYIVVRHTNDISMDNRVNNIDIGTQLQNMLDKMKNKENKDECPF